jgi:hypothetical protein
VLSGLNRGIDIPFRLSDDATQYFRTLARDLPSYSLDRILLIVFEPFAFTFVTIDHSLSTIDVPFIE